MSNQQPVNPEKLWNRKVVRAYQGTLTHVSKLISSLLGLWVIGYLIGWKRIDSYYNAFGAEWIISEVTIIQILSQSYWPLVAFILGLLVTFTDLADRHNKGMKSIWAISGLGLLITFLSAFWFNWNENHSASSLSYASHLLSVAIVLGLRFGDQAMDLSKNRFQWQSSNVWIFCLLVFWFFNSVSLLGQAEGKRDSDLLQTNLNILETRDGRVLRLLFTKESLIYATKLEPGKPPKIEILERAEVKYISKFKKNKHNNESSTKAPSKGPGSNNSTHN